MFHRSYPGVEHEQRPVGLLDGLQVGVSSGSSPPALHQLGVKEGSVSVTLVWPYFTVLSYILKRRRIIVIVPLAVQKRDYRVQHLGPEQDCPN